jgi:hypothetical protein
MKPKVIKVTVEGKEIEVCPVQDGKPVCVNDKGDEVPFDVAHAVSKVKEVSEERDILRGERDTLKTALGSYVVDGAPLDPEKAKEAVRTFANLDKGKLKDAAEVEEIKRATAAAYEAQITSLKSSHSGEVSTLRNQLYEAVVGEQFGTSTFVKERLVLPPDIARDTFGNKLQRNEKGEITGGWGFALEDGKMVPYLKGAKIFSSAKPGNVASFDEALAAMVNEYPHKESILKGSGAGGTGAQPNLGGSGGKKSVDRATFDAWGPEQQRNFIVTEKGSIA